MNKKFVKLLIVTLSVATMAFAAASCNFSNNGQTDSPSGSEVQLPESAVKLDKTSATMDLYETLALTASLENLTGEVVWTTSDAEKATVANGVVTSLSEGEVTITATVGEKSASCVITITSSGQIPVLSLNNESVSLKEGSEFTLIPTLKYKDATVDATFDYSSADPTVATVENGKVTAVASGNTTITVMVSYLGFQTAKVVSVNVTANVAFDLSESEITLGAIEAADYFTSKTVTATVVDNGVTVDAPIIAWATKNAEVATVENGVITAVGAGETTVTATYVSSDNEEFIVNVKVIVEKPVLDGVLTNNVVDLDADESATVAIALDGIDASASNLVKVVNKSKNNAEIAFTVEDGKVVLAKEILAAGIYDVELEFTKVIYNVSVKVTADVIDVVSFATPEDVDRLNVLYGLDLTATHNTERVYGDELGSVKFEIKKSGGNYVLVKNPLNKDISDYDYLVYRVYNASQTAFTMGTNWAADTVCLPGQWTDVKIPASLFVEGSGNIVDMNENKLSMSDVTGFVIRLIDGEKLSVGDCFYISALQGVKIKEEVLPENVVASFDTASGLNYVSLAWGANHTMAWSDEVKLDGENGSLKVTCVNAKNNNYLKISNPYTKDVSGYDYIEFSIYNPTECDFKWQVAWGAIKTLKAGEWTTYRLPISAFSNGDVSDPWSGAKYSATDITNVAFYIDASNMEFGDCIYISSMKAGYELKEGDVAAFDKFVGDVEVFGNKATVEHDTTQKYEDEKGSLKVTMLADSEVYISLLNPYTKDISEYDYLTFKVFNPTQANITVGTLWAGDTTCAPNEWTEIKILREWFEAGYIDAISGSDVLKTDITGFAIRFVSGFAVNDVFYVSAVKAEAEGQVIPEVGAEVVVDFNEASDLDRLDNGGYELALNTDSAYIYGEEAGSLKVTNAGQVATGDSQITITNPINKDMSAYDYISFRVYNATGSDIQVGTWWNADTVCKAGEWTDIKITVDMFKVGSITVDGGMENVTNLRLRIITGLPAGGSIYISSVVGGMNPEVDPVVGPEVVVDFNMSSDLDRLNRNGYEISINKETTYIFGSETGSLKVKNPNDTATGDSTITLVSPLNADISAYDYVSFRVYNATGSEITVGSWWCCDTVCAPSAWTEIKVVNGQPGLTCTFANMANFQFRFCTGLPAGGEIYISALTAGMNPVAENPELIVDFNEASDLDRLDNGGYELSINTDATYLFGSETGSLKIKNAASDATGDSAITVTTPVNTSFRKYDYISFRVYNATDSAITVGSWWCADTSCAPGQWTEVKITKVMALDGCSFSDITGLKLRLCSGLPAGGEIYISAVLAGDFPIEEGSEVIVDFNEANDLDRLDNGGYEVSINTDSAYIYGEETGSLKVTNAGSTATGDSQLVVSNPVNKNMIAFDYISFRVYNATDSDITVGTWWQADTVCKAGEWTEIKITYEMFKAGSITVDGGMENVTNLRLRITTGLPAGGSIYISSVVGGVNA